jgi:cyclin-dependent kinase
VSQLPEYKRDFEIFPKIQLETLLPKLDPLGIDLLKRLLEYPPEKRITSSDALQRKLFFSYLFNVLVLNNHLDPYFDELRKKELSTNESNHVSK